MKTIALPVKKILVVTGLGHEDRIHLELDLPTTYPRMNYAARAVIETTPGYGVEWCTQNLGSAPDEIIHADTGDVEHARTR